MECGLNLETALKDDSIIITKITLLTSNQSKKVFDTLKDGVSKRFGKPSYEDYVGGDEEFEDVFCGKCRWDGGAELRNVNGDTEGFFLFLSPQIKICRGDDT